MSARPEPTTVLSSAAVGLAIVGAALPETLLQVAGPLLALAVHLWTERTRVKARTETAIENERLRVENRVLRSIVAELRRPVSVPPPAEPLRVVSEEAS